MPPLLNCHPSQNYHLVSEIDRENWIVKHNTTNKYFSIRIYDFEFEEEQVITEPALDSINLIRVFEIYQQKESSRWFVMELNYSLVSAISIPIKQLTEEEIATICREALLGLSYLHTRKHLHENVRSETLSFTSDGHIKWIDWELYGSTPVPRARGFVGPAAYYLSPEIITSTSSFNAAAEIWSFGITLIEMAGMLLVNLNNVKDGSRPLSNMHPMRALFLIPKNSSPTFKDPSRWSPDMNDFLAKCLNKVPKERATATQLLENKGRSKEILAQVFQNINTHYRPLDWETERLLWIGNKKENSEDCHLAKLPREIIKEILQTIRVEIGLTKAIKRWMNTTSDDDSQ